MGGFKNQLTGKYERKFSVSNIPHIKFKKHSFVKVLADFNFAFMFCKNLIET